VHSGAEVLADGDIHIYGRLQGRAAAGLVSPESQSGLSEARIFCSIFEPSLVGISSAFVAPDEFPVLAGLMGRPVSVSLSRPPVEDFVSVSCDGGQVINFLAIN